MALIVAQKIWLKSRYYGVAAGPGAIFRHNLTMRFMSELSWSLHSDYREKNECRHAGTVYVESIYSRPGLLMPSLAGSEIMSYLYIWAGRAWVAEQVRHPRCLSRQVWPVRWSYTSAPPHSSAQRHRLEITGDNYRGTLSTNHSAILIIISAIARTILLLWEGRSLKLNKTRNVSALRIGERDREYC